MCSTGRRYTRALVAPRGARHHHPMQRAMQPAMQRAMQAVVLAGGLGTRMLPATARVPKLLLPVLGRPFASWLLPRLARAGFTEALLCVGHLGGEIRAALGDGSGLGLRLRYSDDGDRPLGTAGALRHALADLAPAFLVTYGDSYLPLDYAAPLRALHARPDMRACMAAWPNRDALEPSNAAIAGDRVVRYDKTRAPGEPPLQAIDYGATALRREVVASLPEGEFLGLDAVQARLAAEGSLLAHVVGGRFYEIGSPAGLAALEEHLRAGGDQRAS
jgi:NDP-sugar pyrophosphorylase family protein